MALILAGDVGGTKARLALFEATAGVPSPLVLETYPSAEHGGLDEIVRAFRERHPEPVDAAAVGVAGPVMDGRVETTNLPWVVEAGQLARLLGVAEVALVNDLAALAWSLDLLPPASFAQLQAGRAAPEGRRAVIAAGTGLGQASLARIGGRAVVFPSEGGHADFAPRTEVEVELLRWLSARYGRASYERVLSGPGLHDAYLFLRATGRGAEPAWLAAELGAGDPAAAISRAALEGRSELCAQALDLFVSVYGAEAGNLALRELATGGVYLGGGIAPRILPWLERPPFLAAFLDKGRVQPLLERVPVRVVLDERAGLLGAARCAMDRLA